MLREYRDSGVIQELPELVGELLRILGHGRVRLNVVRSFRVSWISGVAGLSVPILRLNTLETLLRGGIDFAVIEVFRLADSESWWLGHF